MRELEDHHLSILRGSSSNLLTQGIHFDNLMQWRLRAMRRQFLAVYVLRSLIVERAREDNEVLVTLPTELAACSRFAFARGWLSREEADLCQQLNLEAVEAKHLLWPGPNWTGRGSAFNVHKAAFLERSVLRHA